MEIAISILLGIGLSAAVGFRIFLPFLIIGITARMGFMEVSSSFEWISSTPSLLVLSTASVLETLAYFIPWFDNLLDTVTTPLAAICGTIMVASIVVDMEPWIKWALAIIAGGGTAGAIKSTTTTTRATSTMATAGIANPIVALVELFFSVLLSVLSIFFPLVAVIFVAFIFYMIIKLWNVSKGKLLSAR